MKFFSSLVMVISAFLILIGLGFAGNLEGDLTGILLGIAMFLTGFFIIIIHERNKE
jgi:hypothetical protein